MTNAPVRVMCASDRFFFRHVPVMLNSAISRTSGPIEIGILVQDIAPSEKKALEDLFPDTPIRFFDVDGGRVAGLTYKFALSPMAYARILIADLVDWDRFLYLDVDVIVQRDLRELFDVDLGAHPVAGVLHGGRLNSGVLLIDGAAWRREGLTARILEFARQHRPKEADQAAIEATIGDRILPLDPRWNTLIDPVWAGPEQERADYLDDAWIVHYLTGFKPWNLGRWLLPRRLLEPWDRHRVKARLPRMWGAEAKLLAWQLRVLGLRRLGLK
jgi:lipopolysaccharide biosynthesis glycosyltransferase